MREPMSGQVPLAGITRRVTVGIDRLSSQEWALDSPPDRQDWTCRNSPTCASEGQPAKRDGLKRSLFHIELHLSVFPYIFQDPVCTDENILFMRRRLKHAEARHYSRGDTIIAGTFSATNISDEAQSAVWMQHQNSAEGLRPNGPLKWER